MQSLALDTGGIFFNNSNDLEAGFRKALAFPKLIIFWLSPRKI